MERIDVTALREKLASDTPPVLVDVRSAGEFAGGHVPQAINLPLGSLPGAVDTLKGRGEIHLICRSGARSARAASIVEQAGLKAVNVEGGTSAWMAAGHPVKRERSLARLLFPALAALTLGLAPFSPEPHLVGKLRWVAGGASGMGPMDWFDLVMHGAPWVWLAVTAVSVFTTPSE